MKGIVVHMAVLVKVEDNEGPEAATDNLNLLVLFPGDIAAGENNVIVDWAYIDPAKSPHLNPIHGTEVAFDPAAYKEGDFFPSIGLTDNQYYGVCDESEDIAVPILGYESRNLNEAIGFAKGVHHQRKEADILDEYDHVVTVSLYNRNEDGTVENVKEVWNSKNK